MKKVLLFLFCVLACYATATAQTVTKTRHTKAIATDEVTQGTLTIRKPDYICISTDNDTDQLIMDGTKFTMTMGKKKQTTDSQKNAQFATFQKVLHAVINGHAMPVCDDLTTETKNGLTTLTITPKGKKRRLFTSFVLVVQAKTGAFKTLRMNDRRGGYTEYTFK